jgi:hypothetical protein
MYRSLVYLLIADHRGMLPIAIRDEVMAEFTTAGAYCHAPVCDLERA